MIIELPREGFAALLRRVAPALPAKTTFPILECVKLEFGSGQCRATTTDTKIQAVASMSSDGEGAFATDAAKLTAFVTRVSEPNITISVDEGTRCSVKCGRSRGEIPVLDARDFPMLDAREAARDFEINAASLDCLLRPLAGFVSQDMIRPILTGPTIIGGNGELRGYASDGVKLFATRVSCPDVPEFTVILQPGMPVPKPANASDRVAARIATNLIEFSCADTTYIGKLIDGEAVAFDRLAETAKPVDNPVCFYIEEMKNALTAAKGVVEAQAKTRRAQLIAADGVIKIHAGNIQAEEFFDEVDCRGELAKPLFVNSDLLLDCLNALGGEGEARLHCADHVMRIDRIGNDRDFAILAMMGGS